MNTTAKPDRGLRWAWVVPAAVSAALTLIAMVGLDALLGDDDGGFPRKQVAAPAPRSTQSTPTATAAGPPGEVVLGVDGLGVVKFGEPATDVVDVMRSRLGSPDEDDRHACDSPPKPSRWVRWADLSLHFSPDRFVGYIEGVHFPPGRAALGFHTTAGLSPGDSVQRLRQIYGRSLRVRTEPPQPGRPASSIATLERPPKATPAAQPLSAVIERANNTATVSSIFAGQLC